jgi:Bacterial extracellular solute-binding proteins, family 5 Middle
MNLEEQDSTDKINPSANEDKNPRRRWILEFNTKLFRVEEWEPGKYAKLIPNLESVEGTPYVDAIEIQIGRTAHDRLIGLELGKSDLAPLTAEMARQAADRGVRLSLSKPDELLAVAFTGGLEPGKGASMDAHAREALVATIDRASIVNFILQKNGEAAGGLLPQWSSGTAFLFSTAANPARAKELWAQIPGAAKLTLGYDSDDALEQSVAERIVVNAREAGIQVSALAIGKSARGTASVDARLMRLRMSSSEPRAALEKIQTTLAPLTGLEANSLPDPASPEEIYMRERAILDTYRVVPLVWLPQVYGLSARLRNWVAPGPGETWPLADVWLDTQGEVEVKDKP